MFNNKENAFISAEKRQNPPLQLSTFYEALVVQKNCHKGRSIGRKKQIYVHCTEKKNCEQLPFVSL